MSLERITADIYEKFRIDGWKYDYNIKKLIKPSGEIQEKTFCTTKIDGEHIKVNTHKLIWILEKGYTTQNVYLLDKNKSLFDIDNLAIQRKIPIQKNLLTVDKAKILLKEGFTYNKETGEIYSFTGKKIQSHNIKIRNNNYHFTISSNKFAWFVAKGEPIPNRIVNIDRNLKNFKANNLTTEDKVERKKLKPEKIQNKKSIYNYYIDDTELFYNVLISKGKGKRTDDLEMNMIKIAKEVNRKFHYYDEMDREDAISSAILSLFEEWHNFNEYKYEKALPYFTEISKRSMARFMNLIKEKSKYKTLNKVSLNEFYSL